MEKIEVKVLVCFYEKHLLIFKILTETLFKMVIAAFRILKSNSIRPIHNYLNFPTSSPAYRTYPTEECVVNSAAAFGNY
jgi:hypothetical protein